jgi:hypothetical protein
VPDDGAEPEDPRSAASEDDERNRRQREQGERERALRHRRAGDEEPKAAVPDAVGCRRNRAQWEEPVALRQRDRQYRSEEAGARQDLR